MGWRSSAHSERKESAHFTHLATGRFVKMRCILHCLRFRFLPNWQLAMIIAKRDAKKIFDFRKKVIYDVLGKYEIVQKKNWNFYLKKTDNSLHRKKWLKRNCDVSNILKLWLITEKIALRQYRNHEKNLKFFGTSVTQQIFNKKRQACHDYR